MKMLKGLLIIVMLLLLLTGTSFAAAIIFGLGDGQPDLILAGAGSGMVAATVAVDFTGSEAAPDVTVF